MKIIQCPRLNFLVMFFSVLALMSQKAVAQEFSHRLLVADSLFHAKQYTQSFEQYEVIRKQKQFTPALLLKMAYIQEGLSNIGLAMYYLNLYYLASNDKSVLKKMEDMATKFNLEGYQVSDVDRSLSLYHDYNNYITVLLAAFCLLMMSIMWFTKAKANRRPVVSGIFFMIVLIAFFIHINYGAGSTTAVIAQSKTYIMEGPSAGAPVAAIVDEGHRVEVFGNKDIWQQIKWNDDDAYVKNNALLNIEL